MERYNIAIDGPAGAGKSTVAKMIAKKLNFTYIDTGAMYRAVGLYLVRNNTNLDDDKEIKKACDNIDMKLTYENGIQQVIMNDENVSSLIRTEEIGKMASTCSKNLLIRQKLVALQQKQATFDNVVMDGRDIGTVVLPNATVKIFLTASSRVRAKRRFDELTEKGVTCDLEEIEADIVKRDEQDSTREHSPLMQAKDAVLVDTSNMDIEGATDYIINLFNEAKKTK